MMAFSIVFLENKNLLTFVYVSVFFYVVIVTIFLVLFKIVLPITLLFKHFKYFLRVPLS